MLDELEIFKNGTGELLGSQLTHKEAVGEKLVVLETLVIHIIQERNVPTV